MSQKTHFFVGLPHTNHWSKLVEVDALQGRAWISLALVGEDASSVGKELEITIASKVLRTAEDLYQTLLALENIALDNQVKLSLAAAFLSLKQWTFFSFNALVGLKRSDQPLRWIIPKFENELQAKSGKQQLGDLVVFVSADLHSDLSRIDQAFARVDYTDSIIAGLDTIVNQQSLLASASLTLIDTSGLLKLNRAEKFKHKVQPTKDDHAFDFKQDVKLDFGFYQTIKPKLNQLGRKLSYQAAKTFSWFSGVVLLATKSARYKLEQLAQSSAKQLGKISEKFHQTLSRPHRPLSRKLPFLKRNSLPRKININPEETIQPKEKTSRLHLPRFSFRNKKVAGLAVLALALVLMFTLVVGWQLKLRQRQSAIDSKLVAYTQRLELLKTKNENQLIQTRDEANQLAQELQALKSQYQKNSLEAKAVDQVIQATDGFIQSIAGKSKLQALPVYLDVSQFAADFVISSSFFAQNHLWLLDQAKKALIIYDTKNSQTYQQALISLKDVRNINAYKEKALLLDAGVYLLDPSPTANPKSLIAASDLVESSTLVASFGDYVYLYNPEKANIFRFGPDFDKDPKPWLKVILGGDYNQVVSWAIDGGVWLSTKTGMVNYYKAGKKTNFTINGLESKLSGPVYLATTRDIDKLYLLEPSQNRVIELDKNGNFIQEVKNYVLGSATGLVYDDSANQVLAISGSVVYQVPLE